MGDAAAFAQSAKPLIAFKSLRVARAVLLFEPDPGRSGHKSTHEGEEIIDEAHYRDHQTLQAR
jgi:hypothetical protein